MKSETRNYGIMSGEQISRVSLVDMTQEQLEYFIYNAVYTHHSGQEACEGLAGAIITAIREGGERELERLRRERIAAIREAGAGK